MPPFSQVLARDGFDGANTDDIDGRTPDGDGLSGADVGTWERHPGPAGTRQISIRDNTARRAGGTGYALYRLKDIPGITSEHGAESIVYFPNTDPPGFPAMAGWTYEVTGHDGDLATGPNAITPVTGELNDITGGSHDISGLVISGLELWDNGAPKAFTLDCLDAPAGADPGSVPVRTIVFRSKVHLSASGTNTYTAPAVDWAYTIEPTVAVFAENADCDEFGCYSGMSAELQIGSGTAAFYIFGGGTDARGTTDVTPVSGTEDPADLSRTGNHLALEFSFTCFGTASPGGSSGGDSGQIEFDVAKMFFNTSTDFVPGVGNEYAYAESYVRLHATLEQGYLFGIEFDHLPSSSPVSGQWWAYAFDEDNLYTLLRSGSFTPAHDTPYAVQLDVDSDDVLHGYIDGVEEFTFDLNTDLADFTGETVPIYTEGDPGIGLFEGDNFTVPDGVFVYLQAFTAYGGVEVPCEGPPENPYPENPPPVPPEEIEEFGEFPMKGGSWRTPNVPSEPMRGGVFRASPGGILTKHVMKFGVWRKVISIMEIIDTDPPPDTEFPPHYDPCEIHPPLPLPPTEPLGPPPARLFFAYDLPITTMPNPFTAAFNATGSHSPGNLSQAAARGGYIIGGVGGYSKYQSGGQYSQALMDAWIESHAAYMPGMIANPNFYGQQIMDDHAAFERWNWPSSWDINDVIDEISRIAAKWKTEYPGLRVGIRAREGQFTGSNYPANVDFFNSQYRYWGITGDPSPSEFVSDELGSAASRGHDILFSINVENGGITPTQPSHRVMYEVTPTELYNAWTAMTVDNPRMHGIGMWKYSSGFVNAPGIMDVISLCRNQLEAIGAP